MITLEINPESLDMLFLIEQLNRDSMEKQETIDKKRESIAQKDKIISEKNNLIFKRNQEIKRLKDNLANNLS